MKQAGERFRSAVEHHNALAIVGVVNAYTALLAQQAGHHALYLSGAGIANSCFALPDLGLTRLEDVEIEVQRICARIDLPLLVDADTGWSDPGETARRLSTAGAAAMHIEDQIENKRCGHRPNKTLVPPKEMCARITAAVQNSDRQAFVIMARTDAFAVEGMDKAIERSLSYIDAGAEMIFAEALPDLQAFKYFCRHVPVPILANMTEFGKTTLYPRNELAAAGIAMTLYPLTAFRAMNATAKRVYHHLIDNQDQSALLADMQTRAALYRTLDYESHEHAMDSTIKGQSENKEER